MENNTCQCKPLYNGDGITCIGELPLTFMAATKCGFTIHQEMLVALKLKNFLNAVSVTNSEDVHISAFRGRWLVAAGFAMPEYEQEPCFSHVLETAGFSAVLHLQDCLC